MIRYTYVTERRLLVLHRAVVLDAGNRAAAEGPWRLRMSKAHTDGQALVRLAWLFDETMFGGGGE